MNTDEQRPSPSQRFWRGSRRAWRWTRWTFWGALALFAGTLLYLNRVGLPDFLKTRLQAELHERGLRLEFKRLFIHPARGIVAEELHLIAGDERTGLEIRVPSADLGLNLAALLAFDVKVDSLLLRDGRVRWPLSGTNQPPRILEADRLTTGIHFRDDDRWDLNHLRARVLGLNISANGSLANASQLGAPRPRQTNELERAQIEKQLRELLAHFDQVKFAQPPEIRLNFHADAHTGALEAELAAHVARAESPWVSGRDAEFTSKIKRVGDTNMQLTATAEMKFADGRTKWGDARGATVSAKATFDSAQPGFWKADGTVSLAEPRTRWGEAQNLTFTGELKSTTNQQRGLLLTFSGEGKGLKTEWGNASGARTRVKGTIGIEQTFEFSGEGAAALTNVRTRWGEAQSLTFNGETKPAIDRQHLSLVTISGEGQELKTEWGTARRGEIDFTQAGSANGVTGRTARVKLNLIKTPEAGAAEATFTAVQSDVSQPRARFTGRVEKPHAQFGSAEQMLFSLDLTNAAPWSASATATFNAVVTPHVRTPQLLLNATARPGSVTNTTAMNWNATVGALESEWARATNATLRGSGEWLVKEKRPAAQTFRGQVERVTSRWGDVAGMDFNARIVPPPNNFVHKADASWGAWKQLEPFTLEADVKLESLHAEKLEAQKVSAKVRWRSPELTVETLEAALYGGSLAVTGRVDVASRQATVRLQSDIDPHRFGPLLGTNTAKWLAQFAWEKPPRIEAQAKLKLPAWTNAPPSWDKELWPTLDLKSAVTVGRVSYSGVSAESATTDLLIRDGVLRLPNLTVVRPEGQMALDYTEHFATLEHRWQMRGVVDPVAARPLLDEATRKVFDQFQFRAPVELDAELRGRWRAPEATGLRARIATTNLVFKGEPFSKVAATVTFTNRALVATDVRIARGSEQMSARRVAVDWGNDRITIDDARSTMDPLVVTGLIGPDTRRAIEAYRFAQPPTARVNGSLPIRNSERTDLTFELSGGPFQWEKFRLTDLNATVHWVTNQVVITNVVGAFYGGRITGQARLDVSRPKGAGFQFDLTTENADLHELLKDVSSSTNKIVGRFDSRFAVTEANTADERSWRGFGNLNLRDGLLWEAPMVGGLWSVLDKMKAVPVLGIIVPNRMQSATASFTITNSVIYTKYLEIHGATARLHYDGTVGFDRKVDMQVEAELAPKLNVTPIDWLFTQTLGRVTRPIKFRVTGTLDHPKVAPILGSIPLMPFRLLDDLLGDLLLNSDKKKPDVVPPEKSPKP